jgi:hypothetical protein
MGIKGAISALKREAEFLGLTFNEVCIFVERNPYAASNKAIMALGVLKRSKLYDGA